MLCVGAAMGVKNVRRAVVIKVKCITFVDVFDVCIVVWVSNAKKIFIGADRF